MGTFLHSTVLVPVQLREVFLNEVELFPVGAKVGDQVLANHDFSSMTLGSYLLGDPGFDNAAMWSLQPGWAVAGSTATWTANAGANIAEATPSLTAYQSQRIGVTTVSATSNGNVELRGNTWYTNTRINDKGVGTYYYWLCNNGSSPTDFAIRGKNGTTGSYVMSGVTAQQVTLDSWTEVGTRTATECMIFNGDLGTVRIFAGGVNPMGIKQEVENTGQYYYELDIKTVDAGTILLYDDTAGTLASFNAAGVYSGIVNVLNVNVGLKVLSGDVVVNSIGMWPIL